MAKNESYVLKLTQAIVVDGAILRPGTLVELTEQEAKNLLSRGKADLATEADQAPVRSPDAQEPAKDAATEPAKDAAPKPQRKGA